MSDVIHIHTTVEQDGELHLANLPIKRGQQIDLSVRVVPAPPTQGLTAQDLLASDIIGLWADRTDIEDSRAYARQLREQAQRREP